MKRTALIVGLTFAAGLVLGMVGNQVFSAQHVKRTVLQKVDLGATDGVMYLVEVGPGVAAGKHYHPGHEFVYTVAGTWVLEPEGKPPITMKAGDSGYSPPKLIHDAKNASMTEPAKILVVLLAEKGQPLAIPVK